MNGAHDHKAADGGYAPDPKHDATHIEATNIPGLHDGLEKREIEAAASEYVPGSIEEKRLVRKIDIHLLPMLWVMYILNYVSVASH